MMTRTVPRPSALIISGSVGAGHDGAARELAARLRRHGVVVDERDYLDALPRPLPFLLRQGYTATVERVPSFFEWLFRSLEGNVSAQHALTRFCSLADRTVRRWTRVRSYSVVVSTYPLASQTLGHLRERGDLTAPAVTYLTDPAAHRSWVHAEVDLHLTVIAEAARQSSTNYGVTTRTAGPLVPARFASVPPARVAELRRELGVSGRSQVALIVTGSLGLGDVGETVSLVLAAGLVPVVLCGRNDAMRRRIAAVPGALALGWRTDVHELMHAADVLVHNAGGLTFTEALVAGLPAVSFRCIPGHGLANAAALEVSGLAPWARTNEQFVEALRRQAGRGRRTTRHRDPALHVLQVMGVRVPAPAALPLARAELSLTKAS